MRSIKIQRDKNYVNKNVANKIRSNKNRKMK